jgi:carbon monoxide dehydrogenase subunit G
MARIEQSATVNVPPEKAFDYLADVTRHIEWGSHLSSADKTSDGPVVVGSTFATVGKLFGTHEAEVKITELVPNQKITFESQDDSGHFRHEFILAPSNGGTAITKAVEPLQTRGPLKLFSPILPIIVRRGFATDLKKIKERLEAQV